MSWKDLLGKGTWWGMAAAAGSLLLLLGTASLLLLRGVLPESAMSAAVCVSLALSCFCGGMWLTALGGDAPVAFGQNGLYLTAAVWGGGLLAGLIGGRPRRKKAAAHRRRTVDKRGKRSVT